MEWEKYFEDIILKRGAEYFKKGKVADFIADGGTCTATVLGSEAYKVSIEFDENGEVADMQCDCPYAESGEYCKHMAAVLYCKNSGKVETAHSKRKANAAAKKNHRIEFETDIESFDDEKADISALKNEIDWTIDSYKHRGFIDYREAYDCSAEVSEIMTTNAELCIETGRYREAFEYSFYVMKKFCSTDMDDSDGGTGVLCDYGIEIWERAIENAAAEKYAFDKLLKYKGTENAWYFKDLSEDFLLEHFNKPQFFAQKLNYVDKRIAETKKGGGYVEYKLGNYLKAKAIILKAMDLSGEAFEKFCADNWKYSEIQTYYIDEKIKNGLYKEAEKLLQKCLKRATRGGVSSEYCRRKLMLVYKQVGDEAAYRKTLTDFVSFERSCTMDDYKELKGLYTAEEWLNVRDTVQKNIEKSNKYLLPEIFNFEGQTEHLLRFAVSESGIWYIKKYEKELIPKYSTEVFEKYKEEFRKMTASASSRKIYKEIVRELRRLNRYNEGKTFVYELVTEWKEKYPNRRAMMEELGKLVVSKK